MGGEEKREKTEVWEMLSSLLFVGSGESSPMCGHQRPGVWGGDLGLISFMSLQFHHPPCKAEGELGEGSQT